MLPYDLRHAARSLFKRPGLSFVIVAILGLGIGSTSTIFSLANSILNGAMPYDDPDRLMFVTNVLAQDNSPQRASYLDIRSWRERSTLIAKISPCAEGRQLNLTGSDEPQRVDVNFVSPEYFQILGVEPLMGRTFVAEDDAPGATLVAILRHHLWQNTFGADPEVIHRTIELHDQSYEVVGILPADFEDVYENTDLFVPVNASRTAYRPGYVEDRSARWLSAIAKLKPGTTATQAQQEMNAIAANLEQEFPQTNEGLGVTVRPLRISQVNFEDMRLSILTLLVGASFILVIGCSNVSNLLLLRAVERRREMAMRVALGSGRGRLLRQLLLESLAFGLASGVAGVFVTFLCIRSLTAMADAAYGLPAYLTITVDFETFAAAFGLALLVGVLVGLIPAIKSWRVDLRDVLQQDTRTPSGSGQNVARSVLAVAAIFAAIVPLVGAGLVIKSFRTLTAEAPGFNTDHLLTARFELPPSAYPVEESSYQLYRELIDRLARVPGADAAGIWAPGIPGYSFFYKMITPEGRNVESAQEKIRVFEHRITPGILRSLGFPLLRGRGFSHQDDHQHRPVAIVSRSAAAAAWPGADPIGKRFWTGPPQDRWAEVVGIVEDVKQRGRLLPSNDNLQDVYFPLFQMRARNSTILLRTTTDAKRVSVDLREVMRAIDPDVPVYDVRTMNDRRRDEEATLRLNSTLLGFFAAVSLFLAVAGIYTVLAYNTRQRRYEIGIRIAFGADRTDIFKMFLRRAMLLIAIGLLAGLAGALALARLLESVLYGVEPNDPVVVIGVSLFVIVVALIASCKPALDAARFDPVHSLRET